MDDIPTQVVKIAIIGTGLIGPRHARSVVACKNATLLCLVDPRPEAQQVAEAFQVPLFRSVQHMLEEKRLPDAAIICTPNHTHVTVGKELLQAGVHILVEKPIATSIATGQDLIDVASRRGRHLIAGHHRRFNPYVSAARQALDKGTIGSVIAVSGLWTTFKPPSYFDAPTQWRAQAGTGGPVLINLVHEVDILQYLLGRIVRVHAERSISQRGHEVEEGAAILLRFASGVVGTFILSDAVPSAHNFESGTGENPTIPRAGKDFYRIFGLEGTLSTGDMIITSYGNGVEKSWTSHLQETSLDVQHHQVPFDLQIANLVGVIRGEELPRCTGEDALNALVVCEAVRRAMDSGLPVDI